MKKLLFKVEDTFSLKPFLVLVPGVPISQNVRVGDRIEIERPNGVCTETKITSIPMICRFNPNKGVPIAISNSFTKEDVPVGTTVFLLESD